MSVDKNPEQKNGDLEMKGDTTLVEVDIERMRAVFGNGKELYNFLTVEHGTFLPNFSYCNLRWMILLWKGQKK